MKGLDVHRHPNWILGRPLEQCRGSIDFEIKFKVDKVTDGVTVVGRLIPALAPGTQIVRLLFNQGSLRLMMSLDRLLTLMRSVILRLLDLLVDKGLLATEELFEPACQLAVLFANISCVVLASLPAFGTLFSSRSIVVLSSRFVANTKCRPNAAAVDANRLSPVKAPSLLISCNDTRSRRDKARCWAFSWNDASAAGRRAKSLGVGTMVVGVLEEVGASSAGVER